MREPRCAALGAASSDIPSPKTATLTRLGWSLSLRTATRTSPTPEKSQVSAPTGVSMIPARLDASKPRAANGSVSAAAETAKADKAAKMFKFAKRIGL